MQLPHFQHILPAGLTKQFDSGNNDDERTVSIFSLSQEVKDLALILGICSFFKGGVSLKSAFTIERAQKKLPSR